MWPGSSGSTSWTSLASSCTTSGLPWTACCTDIFLVRELGELEQQQQQQLFATLIFLHCSPATSGRPDPVARAPAGSGSSGLLLKPLAMGTAPVLSPTVPPHAQHAGQALSLRPDPSWVPDPETTSVSTRRRLRHPLLLDPAPSAPWSGEWTVPATWRRIQTTSVSPVPPTPGHLSRKLARAAYCTAIKQANDL